MQVKVKWNDGVCFSGQSESNHSVKMDGPSDAGGLDRGMRPMELILIGIGGCTSFDVVTILKNQGKKLWIVKH